MMANLLPIISIILPVYNRANLIKETLNSILVQTFSNWECIIVDDHSTDEIEHVVKDFIKLDNRIKFLRRPDSKSKGANSCRNFGLTSARGNFIYWLDSDDIIHPNLLEFSFKILDEEPVDYVRFNRELFFGSFQRDFDNEEIRYGKKLKSSPILIEQMLLNKMEFNTCNIVWRKESLENEKFCEEIIYADEWEYYSRLLLKGLEGRNLKNTLLYGRKHSQSTTFEFKLNDPHRISSKIKASFRVIDNLHKKDLISINLTNYFIRLAFELNSRALLKKILNATNSSSFKKIKYLTGFQVYPLLKPIFNIKGKMLKN